MQFTAPGNKPAPEITVQSRGHSTLEVHGADDDPRTPSIKLALTEAGWEIVTLRGEGYRVTMEGAAEEIMQTLKVEVERAYGIEEERFVWLV